MLANLTKKVTNSYSHLALLKISFVREFPHLIDKDLKFWNQNLINVKQTGSFEI
jgi:hypothetical protein